MDAVLLLKVERVIEAGIICGSYEAVVDGWSPKYPREIRLDHSS